MEFCKPTTVQELSCSEFEAKVKECLNSYADFKLEQTSGGCGYADLSVVRTLRVNGMCYECRFVVDGFYA